jgi:hypothetical protein
LGCFAEPGFHNEVRVGSPGTLERVQPASLVLCPAPQGPSLSKDSPKRDANSGVEHLPSIREAKDMPNMRQPWTPLAQPYFHLSPCWEHPAVPQGWVPLRIAGGLIHSLVAACLRTWHLCWPFRTLRSSGQPSWCRYWMHTDIGMAQLICCCITNHAGD